VRGGRSRLTVEVDLPFGRARGHGAAATVETVVASEDRIVALHGSSEAETSGRHR
jgi:hypothetical protein